MILLVQTPHLENYWPGVYKADEPLWPTGSSVIWHFSPIPTLPTTAAAHCHPLAFHFNRCLILKSHITVESSKAFPTSLPLLLLTFPTWCPLSPSFPTWLTSNSSKFYIKHQLLCKSSLSLVRVCTPICPLLSLNNSPSEHLFHYIWVISVQVLASARLWPPEGLGGTSFLTCRASYNVWPMFVDQYMFVLDYFMADTITWLN